METTAEALLCTHCYNTEVITGTDVRDSAREKGWFKRRSIISNKYEWNCPRCCAISDDWAAIAVRYGYEPAFAYEAFERQMLWFVSRRES